MRNTLTFSLSAFLISWLISYSQTVFSSELDKLVNSAQYEEDIRLANLLHQFIFTHNREWSKTENPISNHSGAHPYLTINVFQTAQLWKSEIKPLCNRFKETYQEAYERELHEIEADKHHLHLKAKRTHEEQFQHDIFVHCDELSQKIDQFHAHESRAKKVLPKLIGEYQQLFNDVSSNEQSAQAFLNQNSATYQSRKKLERKIRVILSWLETDHLSHQNSGEFKQQFEQTQQAFREFIRTHPSPVKTALPKHEYIHDDAKPMQQRISKAFQKKYDITPHHIIIRQQSVSRDIHRLVKKQDKLHGEVFSALSFSAVLATAEEETVSTHFGWLEFYTDGSIEVFLQQGENNFKNPRADQIHTFASRS